MKAGGKAPSILDIGNILRLEIFLRPFSFISDQESTVYSDYKAGYDSESKTFAFGGDRTSVVQSVAEFFRIIFIVHKELKNKADF
jgi:hypothetical protein